MLKAEKLSPITPVKFTKSKLTGKCNNIKYWQTILQYLYKIKSVASEGSPKKILMTRLTGVEISLG